MRRNPIAARRYAQAFFELTDKHMQALSELKVFSEVLESDNFIASFFTSPIISPSEKIKVLSELKSRFPVSILFLEALIEAGRMENIKGVTEEFGRMCDEKSGELAVEIESAQKQIGRE